MGTTCVRHKKRQSRLEHGCNTCYIILIANRIYKYKGWIATKTQYPKRDTTAVASRSYSNNDLVIPTVRTIKRQGSTRRDTFTHNDRSELTAATMGGKAFAYAYDNIGNRKTAQEEADDFTYTANALNRPVTYPRENEDGEETRTILTNHRFLYRGNTTQPLQWSSEVTDTDLGLIYYNYRHYNPLDGRWTGRDLIGLHTGINLYSLVGNNSNAFLMFADFPLFFQQASKRD